MCDTSSSSSPPYARHLVTAALIYANGRMHIGHVAGCYLPADIYVRYLRLCQKDVLFVTGTDEHGVPIMLKAIQEQCHERVVIDKYYHSIRKSLEGLDISFDIFDRTSEPAHHKVASAFFTTLYARDYLEERTSEQYFDPERNIFLPDRYMRGRCPHCAHEEAYGDQCEGCGRSLSAVSLLEPRTIFGNAVVKKPTTHWFLPMERWQDNMQAYVEKQTHWKRNVYQQCISWLNEGLQARAMTRDLSWGVSVPLKKAKGKVLYVWFDAPIGYITATQKLRPNDWQKYWKEEDTQLVHFIGKDNIVFHCLIFPLLLHLHGGYVLPSDVPANEFLTLEGKKLSTSREWAVWMEEYLEDFPRHIDAMRYVLCRQLPEQKDSDFTWKTFQTLNNSELVGILGNFVHRTLHLMVRYAKGCVPAPTHKPYHALTLQAKQYVRICGEALRTFRFRDGLGAMMDIARMGHRFLAEKEPWKCTDTKEIQALLYTSIQWVALLQVAMQPFMPRAAEKLRQTLGLAAQPTWQDALDENKDILTEGHPIAPPSPLFEKITDAQIAHQIQKLHS